MSDTGKTLLSALNGRKTEKVPLWLMRQAGRYLPEYRAVREKAGGFLNLVFNPELAAEVTLQPIRRFGMNGAILFSDILVIPQALGQAVTFTAGEGPQLAALDDFSKLNYGAFEETLAPVYETVKQVRKLLAAESFDDTALIGFAGAPWTVACYMVEGGGSRDFLRVKALAMREPEKFAVLIDTVTQATTRYLLRQIESGAQAVQIFDSWAGVLDETQFRRWVIEPTKKIAAAVRQAHPDVPVIGFPRGAGFLYGVYAAETDVSALGLDWQVPLDEAARLQKQRPVQGNLDPACLMAGGAALDGAVRRIRAALESGPFVFNLGHGIDKETPIAHVEQLVRAVRA